MQDTLSETDGSGLLARLFTARGYAIQRNVKFREYGVDFHIDGWDAKARIGFEFLTSEDDDHDDLSLEEYKTLSAAQQRGELSLFIIDEVEPLNAAELAAAANEFLDEVAAARRARGPMAAKRRKAAKKAAVKKTSAKKKAAVKNKAKNVAAGKRKPVAAKRSPLKAGRKKKAGHKKR